MNKKIKVVVFSWALLFISGLALAVDPPPMVTLKNITSRMTTELDKKVGHLTIGYVTNLVSKIVVPHFDVNGMSRAVVGREYWSQASASTQQQFIKELTRYVINTYASAIQNYDGERLKFYPMRGELGGQTRVQIYSDLIHKDGPPIQISYRLAKYGNQWLIYDYSIDNVSVVQNYRSQFAETLRQGGLEKLLQQLRQHNQGQ